MRGIENIICVGFHFNGLSEKVAAVITVAKAAAPVLPPPASAAGYRSYSGRRCFSFGSNYRIGNKREDYGAVSSAGRAVFVKGVKRKLNTIGCICGRVSVKYFVSELVIFCISESKCLVLIDDFHINKNTTIGILRITHGRGIGSLSYFAVISHLDFEGGKIRCRLFFHLSFFYECVFFIQFFIVRVCPKVFIVFCVKSRVNFCSGNNASDLVICSA